MRGLKIEDTPIINGHMTHYNFIRTHMGLDGRTPAEEAKIDLNLGNNKWLDLLRKSLEFRKKSTLIFTTLNATPYFQRPTFQQNP